MKFKIVTLGCKVNGYESNAVREQFLLHGFIEDKNPDVVVINTCSVTSVADQKSRQHIRKYHRDFPNAIIVVMGCMIEANKDIIEKNDLFTLFEKEFRRVLSQKEITTIAEWDRIYGYDKIVDALRIAVINRMMTDKEISFNYIGKILANGK